MPKPTTAKTYPEFATYRDDAAGMAKAKALAADRCCSLAALLRALVKEEAARQTRRTARAQTAPAGGEENPPQ